MLHIMRGMKLSMINNKICYFNNNQDELVVMNNKVYVNGVLLQLLGFGVDGEVYKYKDKAIKLYHDENSVKEHLSQEQINILSDISTNHIVLPKQSLISNEFNPGFVMEYIDLETKKDILLADKNTLIKELQETESELQLVGENHFLLNDTNAKNLFYNGQFHIFDADSFLYDKKVNFDKRNIEIFVWHFIRDIIFAESNGFNKKEQLGLVRKLNYLYKRGNYFLLSNFLEEFIEEENLKQASSRFVYQKIR